MSDRDDDIAWLLRLLESEDLVEIEYEEPEFHARVSRLAAAHAAPAPMAAAPDAGPAPLPEDVVPVLAPMSGVFYRAPSPESPPYVEEGSQVERGDVIGLIEAMKLFNEIEAPVSGTVVEILVKNGESVAANQRLMLIRVGEAK
ncbi:MAG: biotin carboxyl carrier domain-containing protein [Armatimonadetes bacterium]|nr:biotin carboxyl carrier domain-containing protein [Armatimonadota bacterium]